MKRAKVSDAGNGSIAAAHTLEAACRRILGSMRWERMEELNPSQHVVAIWMLDEGWPVAIVEEAVAVLQRHAWFLMAGVTRAPWEVTDADWEALCHAKPWETREGRGHVKRVRAERRERPVQLEMFSAGTGEGERQ